MPFFKDVPRIDINDTRSNYLESISSLLRWARRNLAEFRKAEDYGKHAGLSSAEIVFIQQGFLVQSVTRLTNELVDLAERAGSLPVPQFVPLSLDELGPIRIIPNELLLNEEEQEMLKAALENQECYVGGINPADCGVIVSIRKKLGLKERK